MTDKTDLADLLTGRITDAIAEAAAIAVRRELDRSALVGADADRAAFIDALARTHSGQPNANRVHVRDAAHALAIKLELAR